MLLTLYRRLSKPWVLILSGGLFAAGVALILWLQAGRVAPLIFTFQLAFTIPRALRVIALWGPDGIDLFINTMWLDFIIPVFYAVFLAGFYARLTQMQANPPAVGTLRIFSLPLIAMAGDWIENILGVWMLSQGWVPNSWLLLLSSLVSLGKWVCLAGILAAVGTQIYRRYKPGRKTA